MASVRRLTLDLDLDQVRRIVAGLDSALRANGFGRLHGGSTEVYRIDLEDGTEPLVLKIYRDEPVWAPAKEALVASWIGPDLGVPIPRWLRVDETRTVLPLRYALMTWLPGGIVRSLGGEPDIESLYRRMGVLLRRLHAIPMPAYGYVLAEGVFAPQPTNEAYMTAAFERMFRRFRRHGADETLARRLEAMARERYGLLAHSPGAVLCHDDFQPGNLLSERGADGELRLSGLFDFANALSGDPLSDLAKALFCSGHEDPRSVGPLLAGYGPLDRPDAEETLWLYTLYHRLTMWTFLTRLGDPSTAEGPAGLMRDLENMAR